MSPCLACKFPSHTLSSLHIHLQPVKAHAILLNSGFSRTLVPSAMTQSVRQEHGTSRISSKSARSMRCTDGSSQYTPLWGLARQKPWRCALGRLACHGAVAARDGPQRHPPSTSPPPPPSPPTPPSSSPPPPPNPSPTR